MNFSTSNFISKSDDFIISSKDKVYVPFLDSKLEIWIEKEDNEDWISEQKQEILTVFLNLPIEFKEVLKHKLYSVYEQFIKDKRITKSQITLQNMFDSIDWENTQILIPYLGTSKKNYIFLLPQTYWKINRSTHYIELELLFLENELILIQEMTGLWTNLNWHQNYI